MKPGISVQPSAKDAGHTAHELHYQLEEFCCPEDMTPQRLEKIRRTRNIRDLLLAPARSTFTSDWNHFHRDRPGRGADAHLAHQPQ
jgi:hypothetical protein